MITVKRDQWMLNILFESQLDSLLIIDALSEREAHTGIYTGLSTQQNDVAGTIQTNGISATFSGFLPLFLYLSLVLNAQCPQL